VEDAAGVGEGDGFADAEEEAEAVLHGFNGFDEFVEALAFNELHGVENAAVGESANIVYGDDAGMFEASEDAGFPHQAIGKIAVGTGDVEDFRGDAALEFFVFGSVDDAHTAARDAFEEAVARAGEVGFTSASSKTLDGFVGQKFHLASQPKTARASR
jgi:hypothetical protein